MRDNAELKKNIWVTWESQRRNKGLSTALGFSLYEVLFTGAKLTRYVRCSWGTWLLLRRERPEVVVAQNPSIFLATMVVVLKGFLGFIAVIDAHNSGIFPLEGKSNFLMLWANWLQQRADLTIVTNDTLRKHVEGNGGAAIVLQDVLPRPPVGLQAVDLRGRKSICFVCTFAPDEPYEAVFEAARIVSDEVVFFVTGKYDGKVDPLSVPDNVELMGFVEDDVYWTLLHSVDFVMDLTLRENCLVCGAYEGVAAGKPLILSDTKALRDYFYQGVVWVATSPTSIAAGVNRAIAGQDILAAELHVLRQELPVQWDANVKLFWDVVHGG